MSMRDTPKPPRRWCATCRRKTTYTVNGIGMWLCDGCRRDNTPGQSHVSFRRKTS